MKHKPEGKKDEEHRPGAHPVDLVHDAVIRGLYSGLFKAGDRLVAGELVRLFGQPRGFVLQALARLQAEGLVEIIPHRGARVRVISPEEARDIDLILGALFTVAARQAAARISEGDNAARLRDAFAALHVYGPEDDLFAYATARERFFRELIRISGNREIARIAPLELGHLVRQSDVPKMDEATHLQRLVGYRALTDAILQGDAEAAARVFLDEPPRQGAGA